MSENTYKLTLYHAGARLPEAGERLPYYQDGQQVWFTVQAVIYQGEDAVTLLVSPLSGQDGTFIDNQNML